MEGGASSGAIYLVFSCIQLRYWLASKLQKSIVSGLPRTGVTEVFQVELSPYAVVICWLV